MVRYRLDFMYYLVENMRFKHIINFKNYDKNFIYGWIDSFNNESYHDVFKYNNNLTYENVVYSIDVFFHNLNMGYYKECITIKHGSLTWKIDDNIIIGFDVENSDYEKLIDNEYLKEWERYNYYWCVE